ncbi:hypothetical protein DAY19_08555 [Halobacteriovorax vibrionivorans]|uniref:DUF4435 domain-containing protein n=1 Tax=Halobacteriovorax vibrionivorans TaxID=2152716 RepID=A0ABY0IFL5_9BACT|nr:MULTISPECIES: hypothetical protein [Halobacteriovorax]RZF21730.1 hypothetical protein DAY19_08555 [Halobacteriovorax vibrionivorans]TGD45649.1 hypothetical protein EP118_15075 [Halobacteriovorax sp. Y22]
MKKKFNLYFDNDKTISITAKEALDFFGEQLDGKDRNIFEFKTDGILKLREYLKTVISNGDQVEVIVFILKQFNIILTLNKYYSKKHFRSTIYNLPSSVDEVKQEEMKLRFEDLDFPPEELKRIEKNLKVPDTYEYLFKQKNESKFFKLNRKNKFYYEYMFYVITRKIYKDLFPDNYWKEYISFLKLCHKHIGEVFIKKLDFNLLDVKDFQERLRYYEGLKDLQLSENTK